MGVPYFAYGSNLGGVDSGGESARFLAVARLDGHKLAFTRRSVRTGTGVADVLAAEGGAVWGALYELSEALDAVLAEKEGAGWAYGRRDVRVCVEGRGEIDAFLYAVLKPEPEEIAPSHEYLQRIVRGALSRGLPDAYVRELERRARVSTRPIA